MGAVQCKKHGVGSGPLCCTHVLDAIYEKGPCVSYSEIKFEILELSENDSYVLDHLIRSECVLKFSLVGKEFLEEDVSEDGEKFPYVCPVCSDCLAEHVKSTKT